MAQIDLKQALEAHAVWVTSIGMKGVQLNAQSLTFKNMYLFEANLGGAVLADAKFIGCSMEAVDLYGGHLAGANFQDCDLSRAQFGKSSLDNATFERCTIWGASFFRASLHEAIFDQTDIRGADFRKAFVEKMQVNS